VGVALLTAYASAVTVCRIFQEGNDSRLHDLDEADISPSMIIDVPFDGLPAALPQCWPPVTTQNTILALCFWSVDKPFAPAKRVVQRWKVLRVVCFAHLPLRGRTRAHRLQKGMEVIGVQRQRTPRPAVSSLVLKPRQHRRPPAQLGRP